MGTRSVPRRAEARKMILGELRADVDRLLPPGEYREFYGWALSGENSRRADFVRAIAVDQLAVLTEAMLGDLGTEDQWAELLSAALPVAVYQVFEVVSDNLALGLAHRPTAGAERRRALVLDFNQAVVDGLRTSTSEPAGSLLRHLRAECAGFSAFRQSLAPEVQVKAAYEFAGRTGVRVERLEGCVWDGLVANVDAGREVLDRVAGTRAEWLVRQGTIDRYAGVSDLLRARRLSRLERASIGARTIMVGPTLSYFTTVIAEVLGVDLEYPGVVEDGTLTEVLTEASLLVRLQNDIGTRLLKLDPGSRRELFRGLPERFPPDPERGSDAPFDLLLRASAQLPVLTRFRKDLTAGEYNLCLSEVDGVPEIGHAMVALASAVEYFSAEYARHERVLEENLERLNARLSDRRIAELISRFVRFHAAMYGREYDGGAGDYAI